MHTSKSGVASLSFKNELEALESLRSFVGYLPLSNRDSPPIDDRGDSPTRADAYLDNIVPANPAQAYDMAIVISRIVDVHSFYELATNFARNIITGFARLNGLRLADSTNFKS